MSPKTGCYSGNGNAAYRSFVLPDGPRISRPLALRLAPRRFRPCRLLAQQAARLGSGTDPAPRSCRPRHAAPPVSPLPTRAACPRPDSRFPSRPRSIHLPLPLSLPRFVPPTSSTLTSLHSSKHKVDATLKAHVAIVCFQCFRCFKCMLQVLYIDVAKLYRDVAHVVMAIHVYSKYFI